MKQWIYTVVIFSQQNKEPVRNHFSIFRKTKHQPLRFMLALMISVCIMFSDHHYRYLSVVHRVFSFLIFPMQYAVDCPVRVIDWLQLLVHSKKTLIAENMKLRYQQTLLEADLQKLTTVKEENSQLKRLLLTASKAKNKAMAAQILAVDTNSARQLLILDKGKQDGAYVGQPVLDAKGVMGQIIDVGSMTSTVLLISDVKSAVPVRDNRTGEHAILIGTNKVDQLSLIHLSNTAAVKKGDLLVTSGLGRLYPEGYPVGYVETVTLIPGEAFVKVDVAPIALLNRNRLVLLIWPDKRQTRLTYQINERMNVIGKMG